MSCLVHDSKWWPLQKRLCTALLEVYWRRRGQVCFGRSSRGHLWWSHGGKVPRKKDHEGRLFLACDSARCSGFHKKVQQLPKIWKRPTSPRREDDGHHFPLTICTMWNWHHRASTTMEEASKVLVVINYFTKWVEAKAIATIIKVKVRRFVWKNIVCRFKIPQTIISDNGRQFDSQGLRSFYSSLGIKKKYSSPRHPQANG